MTKFDADACPFPALAVLQSAGTADEGGGSTPLSGLPLAGAKGAPRQQATATKMNSMQINGRVLLPSYHVITRFMVRGVRGVAGSRGWEVPARWIQSALPALCGRSTQDAKLSSCIRFGQGASFDALIRLRRDRFGSTLEATSSRGGRRPSDGTGTGRSVGGRGRRSIRRKALGRQAPLPPWPYLPVRPLPSADGTSGLPSTPPCL